MAGRLSCIGCCPDGEIGRRKGLKIPRRKLRAGSIPAPGTKYKSATYGYFCGQVWLCLYEACNLNVTLVARKTVHPCRPAALKRPPDHSSFARLRGSRVRCLPDGGYPYLPALHSMRACRWPGLPDGVVVQDGPESCVRAVARACARHGVWRFHCHPTTEMTAFVLLSDWSRARSLKPVLLHNRPTGAIRGNLAPLVEKVQH